MSRGETQKKYQIIYADPPWSYRFTSPTGSKRPNYANGASDYYETMTLEQIKALPVQEISDKNSALFLWATNPMMPEAFEVMEAWGFRYKTLLTWHKERCKGMGYWFRGHTEHLLFGIRGDVKAFRSLNHNILKLPVGKHSEKPEEFRDLIDEATPNMNPKIELFSRKKVLGWDAWGNEVESDITLETNHGER